MICYCHLIELHEEKAPDFPQRIAWGVLLTFANILKKIYSDIITRA